MSILFAVIPLVLMILLYGVVTRLAAKLFKGSKVQWKHAFVFAFIAGLIGFVAAVINRASGLVMGPLLGLVAGLALQSVLGGWYLGPRGLRANGEPLAFKGGAAVSAISGAILFAISFALLLLVQVLLPAVSP